MTIEEVLKNTGSAKIQDIYTNLLIKEKYKEIKKLEKLTKVNISEEAVTNAYTELFKETYSVEQVFRMAEFTKQYPADGELEKKLTHCITDEFSLGDIRGAKKHMQLLGKKLELPLEEIAEKGYSILMRRPADNIKRLNALRKFTGKEPSDKEVENSFSYILGWMQIYPDTIKGVSKDFKKLLKFTGKEPSEETVQKVYDSYINYIDTYQGKYLNILNEIKKLTKQKPKIEESRLDKLYERFVFNHSYHRFENAKLLKEVFEKNPSDKFISDYYKLIVCGKVDRENTYYGTDILNPHKMAEFIELIGTAPDIETSNAFFKRCIDNKDMSAHSKLLLIASFYTTTKIKPDNDVLNSLYGDLLEHGNIKEVEKFCMVFSR